MLSLGRGAWEQCCVWTLEGKQEGVSVQEIGHLSPACLRTSGTCHVLPSPPPPPRAGTVPENLTRRAWAWWAYEAPSARRPPIPRARPSAFHGQGPHRCLTPGLRGSASWSLSHDTHVSQALWSLSLAVKNYQLPEP